MSENEQARELGYLLVQHGKRRHEYVALSAKLRRIGKILAQAAPGLMSADVGPYSESTVEAKKMLESIHDEVDFPALVKLLDEHIKLTKELQRDVQTLKDFGVTV